MKRKEKNIAIFDEDIRKWGRYQYTDKKKYSAYIASKRQTEEIAFMLKNIVNNQTRILDVGCGDGTYTFDLFDYLRPKLILGFDPSKQAILTAKRKIHGKYKGKVSFRVANIYEIDKVVDPGQFDIAVVRGVLHHLYEPQFAIHKLSKVLDMIIVLEPNGFNPFLKVIEKLPYNRLHEEKSYWPPHLDQWFVNEGFNIRYKKYFNLVSYFSPDFIVKPLKLIEPFFENIPYLHKIICGSNLIFYVRKS